MIPQQFREAPPWNRAYNGYILSVLVTICVFAIVILIKVMGAPIFPMLLLPAVLMAGLRWGVGPALLSAILSSSAYFYTFFKQIQNPTTTDLTFHLLEVIVIFMIVAIFSGRSRQYTTQTIEREQMQAALRKLSHDLAATNGMEQVTQAIVRVLQDRLEFESILLLYDEKGFEPASVSSESITFSTDDLAELNEAEIEPLRRGDVQRFGSLIFYPLLSAGQLIGALGVQSNQTNRLTDVDRQGLLKALTMTISAAVQRELLARKSVEADLLRRHEEFYAALLSSISHDFRTPLASIIGASETLAMPQAFLSEGARQDMISMIREEAERLNRFVSNLLDMTKLESGRLDLNLEQIDLTDIAGTVLMRGRRVLSAHHVEVDIPFDIPMIRADFVLIEHVLTNLVENAVKYSPKGTTIRIEAKQEGDKILISIIDQGRGIPKEELEQIFEKFYRVQRGDAGPAGTGLGLSICRGIIAAHGGEISAKSPVEGDRGTSMNITFPLSEHEVRAAMEPET